ncbi:MAG: hypothetical protein ACK5YO_09970, partial [Planctomyces sp.]
MFLERISRNVSGVTGQRLKVGTAQPAAHRPAPARSLSAACQSRTPSRAGTSTTARLILLARRLFLLHWLLSIHDVPG